LTHRSVILKVAQHAKFMCQYPIRNCSQKDKNMLDIATRIARLRRPKLLVNAARFGLDDYVRSQHLKRLLKTEILPRPVPAVMQLLDIESIMDEARKTKQATYSVACHVEVLIALMAETQNLRASSYPT
jgi:hypothetical protein